jgi:type IV pilus assembly protein PilB
VVPIGSEEETCSFVVSNPFDYELLDVVKNLTYPDLPELIIADPKTVDDLLNADNKPAEENGEEEVSLPTADYDMTIGSSDKEVSDHPIIYITNRILQAAVAEATSDVHIEPKENSTTVRFRIDGDLSEKFTLKKKTGKMVISRLKALAGMDIAEHRKPQDGAAEAIISKRHFVLRLATTATVYGESLVFRLLDRDAGVVSLEGLGMTSQQAANMHHFAQSAAGLVLVVGPTGSGKTTTLYSLFSLIDCRSRSLISVEDPVEYRLPFANQQQVNDKAGINFEALLKSAVRQDPDILFMGEVRDAHSAQTAIQFSSIGRLVLTTLHTSSATSAIFRLEELGLSRTQMADSLLGIISQRLVKRLCDQCKEERPLSEEDKRMLGLVLEEVPEKAYFPVGCPACNLTGYHGREGVFEVIRVDAVLSEAIRKGIPIVDLRRMVKDRGDMLMSRHAAEKMVQGLFTPRDIYQYILTEAELFLRVEKPAASHTTGTPLAAAPPAPAAPAEPAPVAEAAGEQKTRLLIVDDDAVTRKLLSRLAEHAGYAVVAISDGIEALLKIGGEHFDLIITDLNMPNLNGFTLLEMLRQKGIETPVIFITASSSEEDVKRSLALGATDFVQKPVEREAFLARVAHALDRQPVAG